VKGGGNEIRSKKRGSRFGKKLRRAAAGQNGQYERGVASENSVAEGGPGTEKHQRDSPRKRGTVDWRGFGGDATQFGKKGLNRYGKSDRTAWTLVWMGARGKVCRAKCEGERKSRKRFTALA